jgi:zeaxanthin glucosyltransferase
MRVLFVVFAEPGHLHPMIGVAQHLVSAGHAVDFFSMDDLTARLQAAGLDARCYTAGVGAAGPRRARRGTDLLALLNKPALARRWYRHVLVSQVPAQLAALREVVRRTRPDVIATDPFAYAGVIAAEQAHVPWAAVSTQLLALAPPDFRSPYTDYLEELAAERDRLFAAEGVAVRFVRGEAVSPALTTVFATAELAAGGHATCVGPAPPLGVRGDERSFPWERLRADKPLVYASFGSQLAPPTGVYEALATAVGPDEADVVIATRDGELAALAPHVTVVAWAPQLALLERARVMVTHGGANSVAEALACGVPLLIVPLGYDQPLQGCLVERAGAGIALEPEAATRDAIAAALRALLADGPQRRRAAELRASYTATNGSRRVAELLVGLVR